MTAIDEPSQYRPKARPVQSDEAIGERGMGTILPAAGEAPPAPAAPAEPTPPPAGGGE